MMNARLHDALGAWKAGHDLRTGRSQATFYRLRKELFIATGRDIAVLQSKSNVVPLRRTIYAYEGAGRPDWADELDEALKK